MKVNGAKKQTLFLTAVNGVVRALGLLMRVFLSRMLGAEIMGIMELAQSVHMVVITPLTSGLPSAISRLTAKSLPQNRLSPLHSGLWIARVSSAVLIPLMWIGALPISRLMGDVRVLPSLWFSAPCILILGYSAAYNGYCYGADLGTVPAISELIEQISRFTFTILFLHLFQHFTPAWAAAVPTAATMLAEIIGLVYVIHTLHLPNPGPEGSYRQNLRPVSRLAFPTTVSRLLQTALRSLTAILIPVQLQRSGLSTAEATMRLGMLNGMVMPVLMLPCIFTSALSMVALPKIAKAEEQPSEMRRLLLLCAGSCIPFSIACSAAIHLAAPLLAIRVYRLPELTVWFRMCAPMTLLLSFNHLAGSILSALGQQKRSLYASCAVSVVTLTLTWLWAENPSLRLAGVIQAMYVGHFLSLFFFIFILVLWKRDHQT